MMRYGLLRTVAVCLMAPAVGLSGCAAPTSTARETPKATAEAFVEAIQNGEYEVAAAGFDYETYARANNDNWDSIPPGQQGLIVGKLREDKARQLQALSGMMTGEVSVGEARQQGDRATVPLSAGPTTIELHMVQKDGLWYIQMIRERTGG